LTASQNNTIFESADDNSADQTTQQQPSVIIVDKTRPAFKKVWPSGRPRTWKIERVVVATFTSNNSGLKLKSWTTSEKRQFKPSSSTITVSTVRHSPDSKISRGFNQGVTAVQAAAVVVDAQQEFAAVRSNIVYLVPK
jgi:hypothetical protein